MKSRIMHTTEVDCQSVRLFWRLSLIEIKSSINEIKFNKLV